MRQRRDEGIGEHNYREDLHRRDSTAITAETLANASSREDTAASSSRKSVLIMDSSYLAVDESRRIEEIASFFSARDLIRRNW